MVEKMGVEMKAANRKKRVPLGVQRLKMSVGKRQGFNRRWVNDTGDRLNQAMEGGYNFAPRDGAEFTEEDVSNRNDSINNAISKPVNSGETKAFLMEIPTALYKADQKEKADSINETENGLRRGADGRYIPREGIKIT